MNPYNIVSEFEKTIAEYAGSRYAVAVESCCAALFLCCVYKKVNFVWLPKRTYPGVACSVIHAKGVIKWSSKKWAGIYKLSPHDIIDSALRFKKDMYIRNSFYCLSFHAKKLIPIGRGGMILCDDVDAYNWFKKARFDGRTEGVCISNDIIEFPGWNIYMTPEQAARGLMLFDLIKDKHLSDLNVEAQGYPDLSLMRAFQ